MVQALEALAYVTVCEPSNLNWIARRLRARSDATMRLATSSLSLPVRKLQVGNGAHRTANSVRIHSHDEDEQRLRLRNGQQDVVETLRKLCTAHADRTRIARSRPRPRPGIDGGSRHGARLLLSVELRGDDSCLSSCPCVSYGTCMKSLYDEAESVVLSPDSTPLSLSTVRVKNPGDGPRVLLLHGNPGTLDDFASLIPHLSFASEVVAFDLPGFGKSPPPVHADTPFSLAGLAKVALSLADQMGWQRFDVIGHSHGAGVAQAMAWHSSQRIEHLLLLGSLGYPAHAAYRQMAIPGVRLAMSAMAACLSLPGGRAWLKSMQRGIVATAYFPEAVSAERLERDVDTMMSAPWTLPTMARLALSKPCADLAAHAASIDAPTLFLHGSSDRLVSAHYPRAVHELRVRAGRPSSFELLSDAGHMLPITHAEHVASRYREMIAST